MSGLLRASLTHPACAFALALASLSCSPSLTAQTRLALNTPTSSFTATPSAPAYSSSLAASSDTSPEASPLRASMPSAVISSQIPQRGVGPFSAVAFTVKFGIAGAGLDITTPIAQRANLRVGGSFFSYSPTENYQNININGDIRLRSVNTSVDLYPFNNRFRISPGVTLYNGNAISATALVPGGQTFTLDDNDFTSSTTDPIHGSASMTFGNKVAPSLTIGMGNVISRHNEGKHFSIPFEIGVQYISTPHINLALSGTACTQGYCQPTSQNAEFTADLAQENVDLNNDISPLRFYPIASIGFAYKFGR